MGRLVLLVTAGAALLLTPAPRLHPQQTEAGERAFREAERLIYSQAGGEEQLDSLFVAARESFDQIQEPAVREYSLGRVALLRGTWFNILDEKRRAVDVLEEALRRAERALELEEFSEGYRLLSDAHSQMMLARGVIYMIRHGDEARSAAFHALELDPSNPRAHISVAGFYLNAPPVAGGDLERGIEVLRSGVRLEEAGESERFLMYLWLSDAHEELGNPGAARRYRQEARAIFPGSPLVAR